MESQVTNSSALMLFLGLLAGCLQAQLNLLTLRESESLVEQVPDVAAAQKKGECPSLSTTYEGVEGEDVTFQVRRECGPASGQLVYNYTVNRRTGDVTLLGDNPQHVLNPAGKEYADNLIRQARQRTLSVREGQCVALEAAKALPGWSAPDAIVSVNQLSEATTPSFGSALEKLGLPALPPAKSFTASRTSSIRPTETGRTLTVDLSTALVRDDETGMYIRSAGLGTLTSKMIALRAPLWLTDEDAVSIALLIPRVHQSLRNGCRAEGGGAFQATRTLVGVSCPASGSLRASVVSIDLETGRIADPDSGKVLESPEAAHLASQLLANKQNDRSELKRELQATCYIP
jgi:hypothetical protein